MKVVTDDGGTIELGDTEATPTIGITDYSRRVTDDFGVTTVVERGFARRMSVRLAVPTGDVDGLQRTLANLRATPAQWIADDRFASLTVPGFYKDFALDLAVPPISFCTLTIEGLAETAPAADAGGDPAPEGQPSTLQLIQPVTITSGVLTSSSVPETDAPEWATGTSYALGAHVIKAATHRIYESLVIGNTGNDPAGLSGKWLDVGPTNRWAMFDQALGTATSAASSIVVVLNAGAVGALALLDVVASTVRVQGTGYDRTIAAGAGSIPFLDLPTGVGPVTVTITGTGTVSVGTLVIGPLVKLGITEASPTAGITDYSRKAVDDFGEVTVVQRAWAKRMTANALIRTDAIDVVANRIASVRAQPSLWIGQAGLDSLTVYGFFKDFSIEVGDTVSKLSLSIEGLSTAAKIEPIGGGATPDQIDDINEALANAAAASAGIVAEAIARTNADGALAHSIDNLFATVGTNTAAIATEQTARTDADSALAGSINTLVAAVGSNAAAIVTEQTARSDADAVIATSLTTLRVRGVQTALNANPTFTAFSVTPGIPDGWTDGTQGVGTRVAGAEGPYAYQKSAGLAGRAAIYQTINNVFAGVFTAECAVALNAGTLNSAGIYLQGLDGDGAEREVQTLWLSTDKELAGNILGPGGSGIFGITFRWKKVLKFTNPYIRSIRMWVFSRAEFRVEDYGDFTWHKAALYAGTGDATAIGAKYGVTLDVNGYATGFQQNNDGAAGSFTINADNFAILKPGGGARTEYSGGNWRIYDAANTLRVRLGIW